jgi:hypothetical protein|nr:MAG TPA: hypothetical protein [Caudoviricetes sp.]
MKKVAKKFGYYENSQYLCIVKLNEVIMQEELTTSQELTEQEWDLIQAIRNYKRAYPNGSRNLLAYIYELLARLLDRD